MQQGYSHIRANNQMNNGSIEFIPIQTQSALPSARDCSLAISPCSPVDSSGDYDEPWDRKHPDLSMAMRRKHSSKTLPVVQAFEQDDAGLKKTSQLVGFLWFAS